METAKTLYSNIVALIAVVMVALIFAGMPLFYGLDTTVDVAVAIGLFAGTALTLSTLMVKQTASKKPTRAVRRKIA